MLNLNRNVVITVKCLQYYYLLKADGVGASLDIFCVTPCGDKKYRLQWTYPTDRPIWSTLSDQDLVRKNVIQSRTKRLLS